jgi:FKBP-type peptidyl-prolyl cis-trans isomerase
MEKFWPLITLVVIGVLALILLNPTSEKKPVGMIIPEDAIKLDSGLAYEEIKVGEGAEAKRGDRVEVHYTGRFAKDGRQFDSSLASGRPLGFRIGARDVIEGWDIGITGMKEGGKRKLYIPSKLAYGKEGHGKTIGPDADLVFDVELLQVKPR